MTTQHFLEEIRNLIARDELPDALEQMRILLADSPHFNEILHQSGRFHNIRKEIRLGLVQHSEANLTRSHPIFPKNPPESH